MSVKIAGNELLVANGKGFQSMANPYGPQPDNSKIKSPYQDGITSTGKFPVQYIGSLFRGTLSFILVPSVAELAKYSATVYKNTPYNKNKEALAEGEYGKGCISKCRSVKWFVRHKPRHRLGPCLTDRNQERQFEMHPN